MLRKIYFLFLLCIVCVNAQTQKNLTVDYKLLYSYNQEETDEFKKFVPNITHESGNVSFRLIIQDSVSIFSEINGIRANDISVKIAMTRVVYDNPIYTNISQKKMFYTGFTTKLLFYDNDHEFLVSKDCSTNWILINDSKIIDGIICYKATNTDYYFLQGIKKEYEVIAWYAPQFANSFGPSFYSGLPGLILEVNYKDSTLVATKITVSKESKKIIKPIGKELVSPEQFAKITSERWKEVQKELHKNDKK